MRRSLAFALAAALLLSGCDGADAPRADSARGSGQPPGSGLDHGDKGESKPRVDSPPGSGQSPRTPAGEVPPNSRRPHDAGEAARPAATGFEFAVPGPAGTKSHYHAHFPDGGKPSVRFSVQADGEETRLAVLVLRVDAPVDRVEKVREVLKGRGVAAAEVLDPATAGGCADDAGHRPPWSALRAAPPVRVVRGSIREADLEALKGDLGGASGLGTPGLWRLGVGGPDGRMAVDVALVEGKP